MTGPNCKGELPLNVAAAPEVAPAVDAAASQWSEDGGAVDGICVAVKVTASEPVDVAAVVAGQHGIALQGVGEADGTAVVPDVWIPDSTTWLARLRLAASGFAPTNGGSVARSPVVLAMPEPVAAGVGWPNKQLGWGDLLQQMKGTKLRTGIVEPSRDAAGLSGLLALMGAAQASGNEQTSGTAALRALATGKSALRADLIARFPRSSDPATVASALSAAPLSEEDVIEYNKAKPPIPLAALYLDEPQPASLDYPFAVMPGTDPSRAAAAEGLFEVLGTGAFRNRLGAQGLRAPDGTWGAGFTAPPGAPSPAGTSAPTPSPSAGGKAAGGLDPTVVDRALSAWAARTLPGRMLAVIDVSGSMANPVPTAGNKSRMEVTIGAAQRGLGLFDDSWAVGLWMFSTEMNGKLPYRQLVPIGPLTNQRSDLVGALNRIKPNPDGNTGIYDTVLAAYKTVQEGWEPGRVNSIVVMTDGVNENKAGLTLPKLLAELKRLADPKRPIQVVMLGMGDKVNKRELDAIVDVTGGGAFIAEDPTKISDIFLKAISLRTPARK